MKVYMVGGAVRDALLGQPVQDRDWVVVGATPEALVAQGFLPVGRDFPVFLHPETREEYALARTERKTARGYHGFAFHAAPDVTLAQDLARRDLTINAIARDADGTLIDPHDGQGDLARRVLRHVSEAFREDPVRILRLARLAARLADFSVAPATLALMREMAASGELDALAPERVWRELSRGLLESRPSRMFEVLRECGALARLLPEVDALWGAGRSPPEAGAGARLMRALDISARLDAPLAVRFACLARQPGPANAPPALPPASGQTHGEHPPGNQSKSPSIGPPESPSKSLGERLRAPADCRELAELVARERGNIHDSGAAGAPALLRLLERCDALRRPQRFEQALLACECDARACPDYEQRPYAPRARLLTALAAARSVATRSIAAQACQTSARGSDIAEMIRAARAEAVARALASEA